MIMIANELFGHIRSVGKEREDSLLKEYENDIARINEDRQKSLEFLRLSLEKEIEKEKSLILERYIREEARKTKTQLSIRKNELFNQTKKQTEKTIFEMDDDRLLEIFIRRLNLIKNRLSGEVKLIAPEKFRSLVSIVAKKSGIDCRIEVADTENDALILEDKGMTVELSVRDIIEDQAEKSSSELYKILFD